MAKLVNTKYIITGKSSIRGVLAGQGAPNYDGDGYEYKVGVQVSKKEQKEIKSIIMDFWNEHKPSGAGDEPSNLKNLFWHDDETGVDVMFLATRTQWDDGAKNIVPMIDAKRNPISTEQYGLIGEGSTGVVKIELMIYKSGRSYGVSKYPKMVQLLKYVEGNSGGVSDEGLDDDFDDDDYDELTEDSSEMVDKSEKKEKKKEKKKKKKKNKDASE